MTIATMPTEFGFLPAVASWHRDMGRVASEALVDPRPCPDEQTPDADVQLRPILASGEKIREKLKGCSIEVDVAIDEEMEARLRGIGSRIEEDLVDYTAMQESLRTLRQRMEHNEHESVPIVCAAERVVADIVTESRRVQREAYEAATVGRLLRVHHGTLVELASL